MVAKKTTKKPTTKTTTKKVAKTTKAVKPAVKKETVAPVQTCGPSCNCGSNCACHRHNTLKQAIILLVIVIATVFATLVVVKGPCGKRGPKHPCPFAKDGKGREFRKDRKMAPPAKEMPAPAPVANAK